MMSMVRVAIALTCSTLVAAAPVARSAPAAAAGPPERHSTLPFASPDGRHVVFTRVLPDSSTQLCVLHLPDGAIRLVAAERGGSILGGWTDGGRRVAYTIGRADSTVLYTVPPDGGSPARALALAAHALRASNDGRRVAYAVGTWLRSRLVVADRNGRNPRALSDSSASWFNVAWSPDDRRLAVTRRDSTGALQVWVMDADGGHARAITRFDAQEARPQWPAWSPDGRRLAVQVGRDERGQPGHDQSEIWTFDLVGGGARNLTPHDAPTLDEAPAWLADGRIVFHSTRSGRFELWAMRADGSEPRPLTR
jgi:TolB protein